MCKFRLTTFIGAIAVFVTTPAAFGIAALKDPPPVKYELVEIEPNQIEENMVILIRTDATRNLAQSYTETQHVTWVIKDRSSIQVMTRTLSTVEEEQLKEGKQLFEREAPEGRNRLYSVFQRTDSGPFYLSRLTRDEQNFELARARVWRYAPVPSPKPCAGLE